MMDNAHSKTAGIQEAAAKAHCTAEQHHSRSAQAKDAEHFEQAAMHSKDAHKHSSMARKENGKHN